MEIFRSQKIQIFPFKYIHIIELIKIIDKKHHYKTIENSFNKKNITEKPIR